MDRTVAKTCTLVTAGILAVTLGTGCPEKRETVRTHSPYPTLTTLAVAPVFNYSASENLDTLKVTDLLFSELQQVEGLAVVPVNRVLARMTEAGITSIATAREALELAEAVGADGIIVAGITEYRPYYPPVVGLAMQIYNVKPIQSMPAIDPVALQRQASPVKINLNLDKRYWPKSQMQRIFNGQDRQVAEKVRRFAQERGTGNSAYGWQFYLRSHEGYLRFVCHEGITELLDKEADRLQEAVLSDVREYH